MLLRQCGGSRKENETTHLGSPLLSSKEFKEFAGNFVALEVISLGESDCGCNEMS